MAEASENLFKVELNTQQPAQACTRPPPVTVVHPIQNQSQQKKHIHKKNEAAASRNTAGKFFALLVTEMHIHFMAEKNTVCLQFVIPQVSLL